MIESRGSLPAPKTYLVRLAITVAADSEEAASQYVAESVSDPIVQMAKPVQCNEDNYRVVPIQRRVAQRRIRELSERWARERLEQEAAGRDDA